MLSDDNRELFTGGVKAGGGFALAGLTASDIAAYLAAIYSLLLIADFVWKKVKAFRASRSAVRVPSEP